MKVRHSRRICPYPQAWEMVFERLARYALSHQCRPLLPPTLIYATWVCSSDIEKMSRWDQTVAWAKVNGCPELVKVPDGDFYSVEVPTTSDKQQQ